MKSGLIFSISLFFCSLLYAQDVKIINIANNDIIYHPIEDRIYTVTPSGGDDGNSLCVINPDLGTVEECYFIGSEPNTMAISDDGLYIYVGLFGTPEVVQFNTQTKSIESSFTLGEDPFLGPYYAEDIEVLPGQNNSIAVSRRNLSSSSKHEGVAIYDNGVMRPNTTEENRSSNSISFAANGMLYGFNNESSEFGFRSLLIDANGVTEGTVSLGLMSGFGDVIESQGNLIFSSNGEVINVEDSSPSLIGTYFVAGSIRATVEPAPDSNVVYFVTLDFTDDFTLETFDRNSYNNISKRTFTDIPGDLGHLINWGTNGKLAFNTSAAVVILKNCNSLFTDPLTLSPSQVGACVGESITIEAPDGYDNYFWSNGETTQSIAVSSTGTYFFSVADSLGCLSEPSNMINVNFDFPPATPSISENPMVQICQGEELTLFASGSSSIDSFLWSNGETTDQIEVTESGTYFVSGVSANGCVGDASNEIMVTVSNDTVPEAPSITVSGDLAFCQGESTTLSATSGFDSYIWSNGATSQDIEVFSSGNYSVQAENASGCVSASSEQVSITVFPSPDQPFIQSNGNTLVSSATAGNQWFLNGEPIMGATGQFYTATESGFYSVQVTINGCPSILSEILNHVLVSTRELEGGQDLLVFPNPSTALLNITYKDQRGAPIPLVELFDARGMSIQTYQNTNQIEMAHLAAGLYFVRIMDWDGSIIQSESVMKK